MLPQKDSAVGELANDVLVAIVEWQHFPGQFFKGVIA